MSEEKLTRAFICISFPSEIVKEICKIQDLIMKKKLIGKPTEEENIHLTLKFLGEIDEKTLKEVKKRLSRLKIPKFKLKLTRTGIFIRRGNPRIIWLKVSGNINEIHKKIDSSLADLFPIEKRFVSHITLARIKYVKDKKGLVEYVKNIKPPQSEFSVNSIELRSSELHETGPIYTILEEYSSEE